MKRLSILTILALLLTSYSYADNKLETVNYVDVERYMGDWYEIAKIPNKFQKECLASRATYRLTKHGTVEVINACTTNKSNKLKKAKGIAFVEDKETNSILKVGFAPFFKYLGWFTGDYYIMELADDYSYALIGSPSRNYLWVLSRKPTLDENIYDELLNTAEKRGFDIAKVKKSVQFNQ